jgi:hypothetical protein
MSNRNTLFKFAGITVHTGGGTTRTKVRYGTDFVTRFKQLNNPKKIEDKRLGICLTPLRVDLVELPEPMAKIDALRWLLTQEAFQSPEDQAVIQDEIDNRTPKAPRVPRAKRDPSTVKVRMKKEKVPSLDDIKSRISTKEATVADVLKAADLSGV